MNEITKELLDALKSIMALPEHKVDRRDEAKAAREIIAKAEAFLADPQPSYDDWIPWKGGECPVGRRDVVMVKGKNGEVDTDKAHFYDWHHTGSPFDIIAYRVTKP